LATTHPGTAGQPWFCGVDRASALIEPESGTRLTYSELRGCVDALPAQLVRLNVEPGDVVAYSLPNGPASVVMFLGVVAAGAAAAPLNPAYSASEVSFYLDDLMPKAMVVHPTSTAAAAEAAASMAPSGSASTSSGSRGREAARAARNRRRGGRARRSRPARGATPAGGHRGDGSARDLERSRRAGPQ
jgi:acyl-CoA synthetase (AMP-forming)/AMP-acid ligase II